MILYIAGLGWVYITANFVVVSSTSKSDQGVVAAIFKVALQVGGSVLGLAILTAVAQGINKRFGIGQPHPKGQIVAGRLPVGVLFLRHTVRDWAFLVALRYQDYRQ